MSFVRPLFAALLLAVALPCYADDTLGGELPASVPTLALLSGESESGWLNAIDGDYVHTSKTVDALERLEFRRSDALAQLTRLRALPLITFAERRGSRFYLGVNADGLFGFHFAAVESGDR